MRAIPVLLPLLTLAVGCKDPIEAPSELSDLSRWLYREWENEDPAVMEAGIANLRNFLRDAPREGDLETRAYALDNMDTADLATITYPEGQDPADCYNIGIVRESPFTVADHALLQVQVDQLPGEPTATEYERTFPEQATPACFADGTCGDLYTLNYVRRENVFMAVSFELHKELRWIDVADSELDAISARSYFEQTWPGDDGEPALLQSYSLDVWIPGDAGNAWRYQVLWAHDVVGPDDQAIKVSVVKSSINSAMEAQDEAVEALLNPEG